MKVTDRTLQAMTLAAVLLVSGFSQADNNAPATTSPAEESAAATDASAHRVEFVVPAAR